MPRHRGPEGSRLTPPELFRILVAVEDRSTRNSLVDLLTTAGFHLAQADRIDNVVDAVQQGQFDAVLLGISSGAERSVEICRKLRTLMPDLGIVVVRPGGAAEAEVNALDAGADDCVVPPIRFREIVARVGAVLRRVRIDNSSRIPAPAMIRAGQLDLHIDHRRFWRGNVEIHLSPREFDFLLFLMKNPEVTLTHVRILRAVWGAASDHNMGSLRSYVKALRRKIERDPANPEYILTEPWVGYRFHVPR